MQVLLAREEPVDGRELAGDADRGTDRVGFASDVVAGDLDVAAVGGDQRRQDVDRRRLARAVRAEQGEHGAGRDLEVDAVEDELLAVRAAQSDGPDRRRRRRARSSPGLPA